MGITSDDLARIATDSYRSIYEREKNGMHALLAFRAARTHRLPVPEWVLQWFDKAVEKIAASGGTSSPERVVRAFELNTHRDGRARKGGRSARERAKTELHHSAVCDRLALVLRERADQPVEMAWAEVAAHFKIATETVRDLYYGRLSLKPAK